MKVRHCAALTATPAGFKAREVWFAFAGLRMAIQASMVVEQTQRGEEMFMTMAARPQQVIDLDALEFLR